MVSLPNYRPKQLSLGPLEAEILNIIWELDSVTVKDVHERIISDPNRELAYTSVTTVLRRLTEKGWLACDKSDRTFCWHPLVTRAEAQAIQAYEQLQRFLAVGNPDVVAAFADSLDPGNIAQLEAIAKRLREARNARKDENS
jgi:predicted transcriptional regulator